MLRKLFSFASKKPVIEFADKDGSLLKLPIKSNESVLDTLLGSGLDIPHSCKAGICKSCKLQCSNPENLPCESQAALNDNEQELGYFLACSCKPSKGLSISLPAESQNKYSVKILNKIFESGNVIKLKIEAPFTFRAGQFCNLFKDETVCRSYSIASKDNASYLEFHVKHLKDGQLSSWVANTLNEGEEINIQGPFGECFYVDKESAKDKPLLLCGLGTGLAPLIGIIKTAISHQHRGPIQLVLGSRSANNFYLTKELMQLSSAYEQLDIHWLASENLEPSESHVQQGDIYAFTKNLHSDLSDHDVYLCGAPSFVQKMKKQCYLNGASLNSIKSDIFQPAQ